MSFRKSFVGAAIIGLSFVVAAPALALDLCLDNSAAPGVSTAANPILIARRFKFPGKNRCKPIQGVIVGGISAITGTACTSHDGDHVTLVVHATAGPTGAAGYSFLEYSGVVYLPNMTGWLVDRIDGYGTNHTRDPLVASFCNEYPDNL
jgi:hypothetical protein